MKNKGLMIAAALILAAMYLFGEEDQPFSVVFTLESLPAVLRRKIELVSDGVFITATRISKNSDFTREHKLNNKEFGAIVVNRFMDAFGLHEN